jgi:hypothetical protein
LLCMMYVAYGMNSNGTQGIVDGRR